MNARVGVAIDLAPFTATERRMVELLSDGFAHTRAELKALLPDELSDASAVKAHVFRLRAKLPPHLWVCHDGTNGSSKYRLVRLIGHGDG